MLLDKKNLPASYYSTRVRARSMHTLVVRKYMMYLPTLKNSTVVTLHTAHRFDEGSSRHDDRGYVMTS